MNVLRDFRFDTGALKRLAQLPDAFGARIIELTKHDGRLDRGVADVAGSDDVAHDQREAAKDVFAT